MTTPTIERLSTRLYARLRTGSGGYISLRDVDEIAELEVALASALEQLKANREALAILVDALIRIEEHSTDGEAKQLAEIALRHANAALPPAPEVTHATDD